MELSHYCFEYDYDTYHPCQNGSKCCKNDYCRCGKIIDLEIKSFDIPDFVKEIKEKLLGKEHVWTDVENYCLGRLFTHAKMHDIKEWTIKISRGYYGEELDGVTCVSLESFVSNFNEMIELSDDDKIRFVLQKEYGYVLNELKEAKFELRLIKHSDILTPTSYRHLDSESHDFSSAIGIYKQIGCKYQIIDGHHRWNKYKQLPEVFIYVAKVQVQ